jgi:hypothetical protein
VFGKYFFKKIWSREWELNPRPADYESAALPLSYLGPIPFCKRLTQARLYYKHLLNFSVRPFLSQACSTKHDFNQYNLQRKRSCVKHALQREKGNIAQAIPIPTNKNSTNDQKM